MNGIHDMGGMHGMGPIAPESKRRFITRSDGPPISGFASCTNALTACTSPTSMRIWATWWNHETSNGGR